MSGVAVHMAKYAENLWMIHLVYVFQWKLHLVC